MQKPIKRVFFDWNGTLLDDCAYGIAVRNRIFPLFQMSTVDTIEDYHAQFTFPIRTYYERAGVTDDNFDAVAHAWMNEYVRCQDEIPLHCDTRASLDRLKKAGFHLTLLTASERNIVLAQLQQYSLLEEFENILALDDIYAKSKVAIGLQYLKECNESPNECVLLGDTLHDAEVANQMGINCLLISKGHQSYDTLLTANVPVFTSLTSAIDFIVS